MNTQRDAIKLAKDISGRSICKVKVGAVLSDNHGIFAWGWNSPGPTCEGLHAEKYAISRANRKRLCGARLTVFASRNGKMILARPCEKICLPLLKKHGLKIMEYTTKEGDWKTEVVNA